jgi:hypothetical protein
MTTIQATWEDEENNRRIELVVDYQLDNRGVKINRVTPERIYFHEPGVREITGSVAVWTEKGRKLLVEQMHSAGWLEALRGQIAASAVHDVLHNAVKGPAAETIPTVQA